jgi:radical SAM protein with 4Fe4S-binding SPASM domain
MAYMALHKEPLYLAVRSLSKAFGLSTPKANYDYTQFVAQLDQLIRPDGACPIHDLNLDIDAPFSSVPSAPYRMDLAITYRCNNDCAHCYNERQRDFAELKLVDWISILDHLWEIGIPHIVFTGGEPTLSSFLPNLIAHAQKNGQITGINTNGRRLQDVDYLQSLVDSGLDHIQITLESHDPAIHDSMVRCRGAWSQTVAGIKNAVDSRLYIMTNTTLLEDNAPGLEQTLDFLGQSGVPTVGLNALIYSGHGKTVGRGLPESRLQPLLEIARERTDHYGQRLVWYTPTQYCNFDPVQMELGVKGCTAALYNMCIEPNGDVLPCQSYYQSLGNISRDSWDSIWYHPLAIHLRERRFAPEKCHSCDFFTECGGGCPLSLDTINSGNPSLIGEETL